MKIAIIGPAYPFRGGLASYNERLATTLQNNNHNVIIYTFTVQYPNFLFPGKTQYSAEKQPNSLNIKQKINSINPFNWFSTGNHIKKQNPDLVIVRFWLPFMGPSLGTILRLIKKNKHTKIISLIDNIIPHEARMGDKLFTKYFLKPVDAFLVMSEAVLNDTKTFNVDKPIALSPHPLFDNFGESISKTEARQKLNLPTNCDYLLFFGLIRKYKGLDLLLKAFADSRFRNRNLKLIIAGEYYADKEYYTNLIKQLQLENEIIQTDAFITDSEVKYYFCASNLVVQPYISATQSGVTQIAYHFNKPMIVTNVGGLAEMCPNDKVGYVVNPNPDEIAGAILKFFDENKENTFIENIIEEKKKYTWEILMDNLLNLHENIK